MKLQISHQTNYFYDELAQRSVQYIRMKPLQLSHQSIDYWNVMLPKMAKSQFDGFGNEWMTLSRSEPHDNLQMQASGVVEIDPETKSIEDNPDVPYLLFTVSTPLTKANEDMREFAKTYIQKYLAADSEDEATKLEALKGLAQQLLIKMPYTRGVTHVGTTAAESFALGAGVCQDHSHVFLACLRDVDIPARYVSGYIYDESSDHMASHAWAEVWVNGNWYTFDVSNQHFTPNSHVYVAIGRDYSDAAPVRGVRIGGGYENLYSNVLVTRLA